MIEVIRFANAVLAIAVLAFSHVRLVDLWRQLKDRPGSDPLIAVGYQLLTVATVIGSSYAFVTHVGWNPAAPIVTVALSLILFGLARTRHTH